MPIEPDCISPVLAGVADRNIRQYEHTSTAAETRCRGIKHAQRDHIESADILLILEPSPFSLKRSASFTLNWKCRDLVVGPRIKCSVTAQLTTNLVITDVSGAKFWPARNSS